MSAKPTSKSIPSRLREIDALFAIGGLEHSRHKRTTPKRMVSPRTKKTAKNAIAENTTKPLVLRIPAWKQYLWLVHGFSTRAGGVSNAYRPGQKCGELNLGLTATDSRENVLKNRELFLRALLADNRAATTKAPSAEFAMLRQIHSGLIHHVVSSTSEPPLRGDGSITMQHRKLLAIQTADCVPILVVDIRQKIVAAFHAGWRGTLARIVERGVGRMRAEFGSQPGDLTAAIGPGIGRCCYSVGEEVRMEFTSQFAYADALFEEVFDLDPIKQKYPMLFLTARAPGHSNLGPSIHLDLPEANHRQLLDAGLEAKSIHSLDLCTACDTKRFFSHRAEQGFTGRMLSVIGILG